MRPWAVMEHRAEARREAAENVRIETVPDHRDPLAPEPGRPRGGRARGRRRAGTACRTPRTAPPCPPPGEAPNSPARWCRLRPGTGRSRRSSPPGPGAAGLGGRRPTDDAARTVHSPELRRMNPSASRWRESSSPRSAGRDRQSLDLRIGLRHHSPEPRRRARREIRFERVAARHHQPLRDAEPPLGVAARGPVDGPPRPVGEHHHRLAGRLQGVHRLDDAGHRLRPDVDDP